MLLLLALWGIFEMSKHENCRNCQYGNFARKANGAINPVGWAECTWKIEVKLPVSRSHLSTGIFTQRVGVMEYKDVPLKYACPCFCPREKRDG